MPFFSDISKHALDDSGNSTNFWILLLTQYKYNTSHSVKLITHSLGVTLVIETEISNC